MPFFSTVYIKTYAFLNLLFMHFDVVLSVFIHPCTQKRRRAQFSIRSEFTRLSVRGKLLTQRSTVTPTNPSVFYAHLVPSGSPYIES